MLGIAVLCCVIKCLCHSQDTGSHPSQSGSHGPPETPSTSCSWSSRCATVSLQRRCICFLLDLQRIWQYKKKS